MLILASASPRRSELMRLITDDFKTVSSDLDESAVKGETPEQLVCKLAQAKAKAVAWQYPRAAVIGCDTVVDFDGEVMGKPAGKEDARRMLTALSGRGHKVHTGVCIIKGSVCRVFSETTQVFFDEMSAPEIEAYIATDEPYDKAGGYAVQGLAAKFITGISGCYHNVMGLPVSALYKELMALGLL